MKINKLFHVLTLGLAIATTSSLQAAVLFSDNFDSYATGSAGSDFTAVYNLSAGSVVIGATGGLGASKSVQTSTATAIRKSPAINTGSGDITIDLFFQWSSPGTGAARPQIGLVTTTTGVLNGSADLSGRIGGSGQLEIRANNTGIGNDTPDMNTLLVNNNWYDLRLTISQTATSGVFSNTLAVYNSDTSGNVGTLVRSYNYPTVSNSSFYNNATTYAGFRNTSAEPNLDNFSVSQASPAITLTGTLGAVNTTYGTASPTPATFTNSAANLTPASGNLTVTPPSGFEVSLSSGSGYSTSLSVPYSGGTLAATNVYVRLAATTAVGTYSGNITVSGGGAASQTIATAASTVSAPSATGTTTTVATSGSPITYGGSVTFTATIAPASGSTVPTGAVQFYTNGVALGSPVTVTTGTSPNGTASLSTTNLPVTGSPHTITANYIATGSFASSAGTLSGGQAVNKATATVAVTPYSVTYDGLGHTATAGTVTGVNGETGATVGTVILSGTTHTNAGSYPSDSWTLTGGANYNNISSTTISNNINMVTPTVLVTGGIYTNSGSPQGPNTFTTIPPGDTGTATWSYVGVGGTAYGPSATPPTAVGTYTAQVTALTADANFNSSASSATAFSIINIDVLFSDNYTVTTGSYNIDFQNTLGRETGSLFPLSYLTRYTGGSAYLQQVGSTNAFVGNTNALSLFGNAGVRIDYDFSTVGAPLDIKFSAIVNWYGLANTNTLTVGNRSDGYDPTNTVFAFQLCKSGTNNIFNNGVATAGVSGINFGDNVLVNYEVVLSDTAGTGSPFGSGGSKAAYYQGGTLLGTATLSQLTAGQGYIGFVGGQGNVGEDNLQISSLSPAAITLTGTLGAVNTTYGTASASPTSFTVSGSNLGGAPGNLTVTPPAGFEVSLSSGSGYSTNLSVPYSSGTLASTNIYVRLTATATVTGSPYSGNITVSGGGASAQTIATASSTVSMVTPTVLVTVGSYTNNGFPQGPNTFTTIPPGDTGTATWSYVGVGGTTYGPSATPPAAAGSYTAQVTALTADANFNSSSSSATAFTIVNANVLFADNYTVSGSSFNIDFQNTLGREAGSLFPLSYLTRYTGADASRQQVGNQSAFTNAVYSNTNALLLFSGGAVRIDYDFSTVGAPLDIKFSTVMNWYGFANTNTLTVGNRSDGYDPTNAVFAFQLCKSGTNNIFNNGVATAGVSGTNFSDFVLVNYEVVLSDMAGTGSPFGSGGSKAAYYQGGILLGTATLSQLTAGQGYIGFVGGQGNVGEDNLQITSLAAGTISLTGTLGAVNTTYGTASPTPTSFTVSGSNLGGAPGNLTVTPPAGFEVSLSSGSSYSTNLSVPYSTSTLAGTTVYVRLAATTALGTYSGNITVAGGGDAEVIATAASVITSGTTTATTLLLTNSVGVTNYYGQPLIFTAVVQTNSVTAADASSNVVFSLGSTPVWTNAVAGGVAYYTNNDLTAGVTNFTAQYLGDINYLGSSVTVTQTVLQAAPTLTLTASGITYGQTLASSSLGGSAATNANNAASVPGGFAFADNTIAPNAGTTNVWVIFTPTDTTNYATVSNTVIVTVGQLGITITAQPNTKVFDGFTTATNVPTVTGTLASGDGFSSLTEAYATATVGTGKTVIPSATITNASGTATANYAITAVNDTGSVITSAVSTNALLLSLGLTPAGTLYPTFGAGQNIYTATNAYTNNPVTVTATSSNVNATLQFSFNGGAYGAVVTNTLTSGSTSLLLNPPTNTVAVRVVSQDLSQTNVYTVNVLLQPSQTVPHLTNSVSGNNLVLSWPADHLGYHLLVQTNNLNKGVSGNSSDWGPVAGSTAITSTNIAIIKTGVTNEYYKLVYP